MEKGPHREKSSQKIRCASNSFPADPGLSTHRSAGASCVPPEGVAGREMKLVLRLPKDTGKPDLDVDLNLDELVEFVRKKARAISLLFSVVADSMH